MRTRLVSKSLVMVSSLTSWTTDEFSTRIFLFLAKTYQTKCGWDQMGQDRLSQGLWLERKYSSNILIQPGGQYMIDANLSHFLYTRCNFFQDLVLLIKVNVQCTPRFGSIGWILNWRCQTNCQTFQSCQQSSHRKKTSQCRSCGVWNVLGSTWNTASCTMGTFEVNGRQLGMNL